MSKLPILGSGVVNNGPLSGGYAASYNYRVNTDGTVATKSRPVAGAALTSNGWLVSPAGEIVITTTKDAGGQITQAGVLTNPDGSACVTTSPTAPFINSGGLKVDRDGTMVINNGGT